jgi:hypothetical protein
MMIHRDSIDELEIISKLPYKTRQSAYNLGMTTDAILDAIQSSEPDIDTAIKYILTTHPTLTQSLIDVVKKNYPDKLLLVEKLAPLI